MQKKSIKLIIITCLFFIFFASFTLAQERKLEVDYPEIFGIKLETVNTQIGEYVKYIFNFSVLITGLILFAVLIYGGIRYLTSFDNLSNLINAREQISAGFLGILVLLFGYIILTTINPQLVILDLSGPIMPQITDRPDVDRPETKILKSSIDVELPLGRIIAEKIFNNSKMNKIKEISLSSLNVINKPSSINKELKELTKRCNCNILTPVGESYCTSDPCSQIRSKIENLQEKNIQEILKIEAEQPKIKEEIKQLKFELQRLQRLEVFLTRDCRLWSLKSLSEFLIKADDFQDYDSNNFSFVPDSETEIIDVALSYIEGKNCHDKCQEIDKKCATIGLDNNAQDTKYKEDMGHLGSQTIGGGDCSTISLIGSTVTKCRCVTETSVFDLSENVLRVIRFWNDINPIYLSEKTGTQEKDWTTFYCQVGGTTFFEQPPQPALRSPTLNIPEIYFPEINSCFQEVPIGEMIDRTKRTAQLLIQRMEKLNNLQKEMIGAIDRMNVLVSQCSSKKCQVICMDVCDDNGCTRTCTCGESPCPDNEIENQFEEIERIQKEIEKTISETKETKEEIGIVSIIEKIIPTILKDLESIIWYPMKECVRKGENKVLFDTQRVIGAIDPKGIIIRTPCYKEPVFEECLNNCFLKKGQQEYRKCLEDCLYQKSVEYDLEQIAWCRHLLNFYCCSVEWNILE